MKLSEKTIIALMLSSLTLSACATKVEDAKKAELPDVIKIGYIGPLTGNAASYGQDVKKGIEIYFEANPMIQDRKVEIVYEDSKCNGQDAASAAQKLITVDKVQFIIGGQCSGETLAAAPIAEANRVLLFSPLSSSPAITTAGDYVFRNYPSDFQVSKTLVKELMAKRQKFALLTEQTDYAQGYREAIKTHLKNANASDRLVVDEPFAVDNTDFRTILAKVKESGADALIAIGQTPVTDGFIVKQTRELDIALQIYGTDTIDGPDFFSTAKDAAEGVRQVVVTEDPSRQGYSDFAAKLGKAQSSPVFPAYGYDAASILTQAIGEVGYDATAVKAYLYRMPTFKGIASDITFDASGDNNVDAAFKVVKNGAFVLGQ